LPTNNDRSGPSGNGPNGSQVNTPQAESGSDDQTGEGNRNSPPRRNNNQVQTSNPRNYAGAIPDINGVLGLKYEKFDKKLQFQSFMDKAGNYVLSTFKDGGDIMPLFSKLEDPKSLFDASYRPVALTEEDKEDQLSVDIYKEKIKLFISRDSNLKRNL
jgi:hypothetical protein